MLAKFLHQGQICMSTNRIIVEAPVLEVRFRNGRKLGTIEDYFASTLSVGDTFYFAGLTLEVRASTTEELHRIQQVVASHFERVAWQAELTLTWQ